MIVQILLGGLSVWRGGSAFGGGAKAKKVWRYHRYVFSFPCDSSESLTYIMQQSASGYLLFPLFLMTAAVGGNYSDWSTNNVNLVVRLLVFTVAPVFILLGLWSRIRLSKMNFRQ